MVVSSWAVFPSPIKLLILTSSNIFTIFCWYLWKQQAAVSSWATCMLFISVEKTASDGLFMSNLCVIETFEKTASGGLFMSNLCVIVLLKNSKRRSLHEQLVCYRYLWKNSKRWSLHEQLVCYCSLEKQQAAVSSWATCMLLFSWKTASDGLFMSNLYVIVTFENNKRQSLHEKLVCYCSLEKQQAAVSSRATCVLLISLRNSKQ